jgi:hypothetical protein
MRWLLQSRFLTGHGHCPHSKQALPRTRGYILTDVYGCTQARASKLVVRAGAELPANYKTVKPVADRVFVMAAVKEEKSMGGILLPS